MSLNVLASTLGTVAPAQDEAHFPPTSEIFWQPLFSVGPVTITRPMVVVALSVGLLAWWLLATTKRAAVVPSKGQFLTEGIYGFVRNGVGVRADGRVVFAISEAAVSFGRFARLFRDALACPNALYLDGFVSALADDYGVLVGGGHAAGPIVGVLER